MACSSTCLTKDHATLGACLRSKRLTVADPTARKFHKQRYSEIDKYVEARYAGLQPQTVFKKDVDKAWQITEKTGSPFRADKPLDLTSEE